MKHILLITCITLASCSTPEQNAQVAAIANLALTYAEAKGKITPQDATLVREAGKVVLTPAPVVDVTSSK